MVKVLIPWKMNFYQEINGYHPLVASFVEAAPVNVDFIVPDDSVVFGENEITKIAFEYMKASYQLGRSPKTTNVNINEYMMALLHKRDPAAQMRMERYAKDVDVVFHHTAPLHINTMPFVIHYESLTTLFWPFIMTGRTSHLVLEHQPIYGIVKALLESETCRGVFTHLKSSHDALVRAFASDIIAAKAKYIPLGVTSPEDMRGKIERKIKNIPERKTLNILFTNSMNGYTTNFVQRGGWEMLVAFERLLTTFPDATLTIVSNKPDVVGFNRLKLKNVVWIEQGIDDAKLHDLLLEADIFALPAVGLHSYSALRAMKFGAVLICSDAPGYEEYVVDGETAIVIPGRMAQVYRPDPETGWMRDDYSTVYIMQEQIADTLARAFERLARHPEERRRIASAAHDHVNRRHALDPWVRDIATLLGA